jgi:hypothetical protein
MSVHDQRDGRRGGHEPFAEALAAHALDALDDPREREALDDHLRTCDACRDELAELRRVTAAVAIGLEPVAPAPELRARVLARATAGAGGRPAETSASETGAPETLESATRAPEARASETAPPPRASLAWIAAAAAIFVAAATGIYAYGLSRELRAVRQLADQASDRADALRAELIDLRLQASELGRVLNVIGAPDVLQASLHGEGAATGAVAHAYWSHSKGLVFQALSLPRLDPDRSYQLWLIPQDGAPISIGVLRVHDDGSSSHSTPVNNMPAATAVAVTVEPAGGRPAPTGARVLFGALN